MGSIGGWLKAQGYGDVDERIYGYISLWKSWYSGKVRDFHCYRQYNGRERISRERKTLGMAKCIPEDWANLLLNERVTITVGDETINKAVHEILNQNRFESSANQLIELTFALGTGAFVEFKDETGIVIDYIRADMIFPLTEINGRITECAFASKQRIDGKERIYLNVHTLDGRGCYVVENFLFEQNGGDGGALRQISLPDGMAERVETGSDIPLFQIIRPNIVNNIVLGSPMGVSVYANAIDQLEGADLIYDSYCNEFRLGKKRLIVPMTFAQIEMENDGVTLPVFDSNDTEFFAANLGESGSSLQEINMELRSDAHETALKTALNALSLKCGMGTGRYRFEEQGIKTATEVISAKSELYQNVRKHELLIGEAISGLCRAIAVLAGYDGAGVDVTVKFDDSIIEDAAAERTRDMQEVREGLLTKWEYRMKWRGEDEATAKKMVERDAFESIEI